MPITWGRAMRADSDSEQTMTITLAFGGAHRMSAEALRDLGAQQIAYARPTRMLGGEYGYTLFRGDGSRLGLIPDMETMIARLEEHGLALISLH
jgi:hypothetical protein